MSLMIDNSDDQKTIVQCALCNKDVELQGTYKVGKQVGLVLSCRCRCAQCPSCGKPAMDVSDTANEITPMCGSCGDFDDGYDAEIDLPSPSERRQLRRRQKNLPKAYSLDERFRKDHPKAYTKWTDDERISLGFCYTQGKTNDDLVAIFQRQPHVISHQAPLCANSLPDDAVAESGAVRMLGSQVTCSLCEHQNILTYLLLEKIAIKLTVNVLVIDKPTLLDALKYLKCSKCGAKATQLP